MPSRHDPADSLADIIENAERVEQYLAGIEREAFAANGLLRDAVERCMERVCEAAHRLGPKGEEWMPEQPWRDIRGMGNRLRHAYDRISLDVIWNAVRNDLPGLAVDARRVLAGLDTGDLDGLRNVIDRFGVTCSGAGSGIGVPPYGLRVPRRGVPG